jgi:alpha-tubulin suppressor-like RCC1 family protein
MGDNQHGQLGLGDTQTRSSPQRVTAQVFQADAGYAHTLFVTLSGSLFSCGSNACGQLGLRLEISYGFAVL